MKLVEVYLAHSESEARMVSGLLESNGIRCVMAGQAVSMHESPEATANTEQIQLLVPANEADKAQKVLELLNP